MPSSSARILVAGVLFYPVFVAVLALSLDLAPLDAFVAGGLLELLPALAVAQVPLAREAPLPPRRSIYLVSSLTALGIGAVTVGVGAREGGLAPMGFRPVPATTLLAWAGGLLAGGLVFILLVREVAVRLRIPDSPILEAVLPETAGERVGFVGVSLCAALGEEAAYRGYLLSLVAEATAMPWAAAVLVGVAFGIVHAYQGRLGVLRTAVVGVALAAPVLVTGSVWPAVAAHALFDVAAGSILGRRLLSRPGRD